MRFNSYLTIEDAEVEVEVEYEHTPAEPGSRIDPPVNEGVAVWRVMLKSGDGSGQSIDVFELLPKAAVERLEQEAWDDLELRKLCPF